MTTLTLASITTLTPVSDFGVALVDDVQSARVRTTFPGGTRRASRSANSRATCGTNKDGERDQCLGVRPLSNPAAPVRRRLRTKHAVSRARRNRDLPAYNERVTNDNRAQMCVRRPPADSEARTRSGRFIKLCPHRCTRPLCLQMTTRRRRPERARSRRREAAQPAMRRRRPGASARPRPRRPSPRRERTATARAKAPRKRRGRSDAIGRRSRASSWRRWNASSRRRTIRTCTLASSSRSGAI